MKKKRISIILAFMLVLGLLGVSPIGAEEIPDVTEYTYTVTPILSPFTYYLYVQTDNPDPTSFRLVDKDSQFYGPDSHSTISDTIDGYTYLREVDPGTYYISQNLYPDVIYEDESIYRVPGGYIFRADQAFSDGGVFILSQKISSGGSILDDEFEETDVTIPCQALNTSVGYLIDTCTTDEMSFFEKLDAVQARLDEIAVYPRGVYDINSPNESRPYPYWVSSPYPELPLLTNYDMYDGLSSGMLTSEAYPFVLDSAGVPSTMRQVAKKLEPDCETASGATHAMTNITFEGETHTYGGAGAGNSTPIFSNRVQKVFTFQGEHDFGTHGTIKGYYELLRSYDSVAWEDLQPYQDLIAGDTYQHTIRNTGGTWLQVAIDGSNTGYSFAYVIPCRDKILELSNVWVDGRYIGQNEAIILHKKFEDYPTADIVCNDVTYTDSTGQVHTQDVVYTYDGNLDAWTAWEFYNGTKWGSASAELPDELLLTRAEVEQLNVDRSSNHLPESGLIYDGSVYPGTPFTVTLVTGITIPETLELHVGEELMIDTVIEPADALDLRARWSCSDDSVIEIPNYELGFIRGLKEGTAVLTAVTVDGGYSATCTVTVLPDPCENGHSFTSYVSDGNAACTADGTKTAKCDHCEVTDTIADEGSAPGHIWSEWITTRPAAPGAAGEQQHSCTACGILQTEEIPALPHLPGDVNGDGSVDSDDAIHLLYHTLFGDSVYPVSGNCDFNTSGTVDSDDAIYLLYHTLFGDDMYPLLP